MFKKALLGAVLVVATTASAFGADRLRVATATSGGTFFANGAAVEVLSKEKDYGVQLFPQATGGSAENVRLAAKKDVELFFGQNSTIIPAYQGTGEFDGKPHPDIRVVSPVWSSVMHVIVAKDSGISSVTDMKGKRIQIGPSGSGIERFTRQPLGAYDLTFDDVDGQRLSVAETIEQMRNGRIDGFFHAAIIPDRNAAEIMSTGSAKIIPLTPTAIERLQKEYGFYEPAAIPAGSYQGQDEEIKTVANYSLLYARADLPEDVVYRVTKMLHENQAELVKKHASFREMTPDNALKGLGPIPLHPGAAKYYREVGILK